MTDNTVLKVLLCDTVEITTANVVLNKTDLNIVTTFITEDVGQYKLSFNLNNNNTSEQILTFGQKVVGIGTGNSTAGLIAVKAMFENPDAYKVYEESGPTPNNYFCSYDPCISTGRSYSMCTGPTELGVVIKQVNGISIIQKLFKYRKLAKRRNRVTKVCKNYAKFYKLAKLIKE